MPLLSLNTWLAQHDWLKAKLQAEATA